MLNILIKIKENEGKLAELLEEWKIEQNTFEENILRQFRMVGVKVMNFH